MQTDKRPSVNHFIVCSIFATIASLSVTRGDAQSASAELGKPIAVAQEAIDKKQWAQAMSGIKAAQAIAKTPRDNYAVDTLLVYVLAQQDKIAEAIEVQERMLNSGLMPAEQVDANIRNLAGLYFRAGKRNDALKSANKVLAFQPQDTDMLSMVMQCHFDLGDYKNAAAVANKLVAGAEQRGNVPDRNWLRTAQNAYLKLQDRSGERAMLLKLVKYYQTPGDWESLLASYADLMQGDAMKLEYFRLRFDTDSLKQPLHYEEHSHSARETGLGFEAQQVLERGFKKDHFKNEAKSRRDKYQRMVAMAKEVAAGSKAAIAKLESEAPAAADGRAYVRLGALLLDAGNPAAAVDAFQKGIKKGGLVDADQAQIDLARAHLKANQRELAAQALRAIKKDSKWHELAELWALRAAVARQTPS
jgi:tetratricopeptide (TPR) repeat protein